MNNNGRIDIEINLKNYDSVIKKLERIEQIFEKIKKIDNNFSINNVIETNKDTILIFNCECLYKNEDIQIMKRRLTNDLGCKCVILRNGLTLDKAIEVDYAKEKDYTTTTYYDQSGNLVK